MSATSPPISLITPDPGADEARRRGLRQMRTVAVGLLLLAACVYIATLGRDGFWGFVNAGAEASMVGAIADWFAVTALFKHPLGLAEDRRPALLALVERVGGDTDDEAVAQRGRALYYAEVADVDHV